MDINRVKAYIDSPDGQKKMKAITELRKYDPEIAVPLLKAKINDSAFIVRSFVAMGLGKKQNPDGFVALLEMMNFDRDPNVRAEAANSLSLFGKIAASHLVVRFEQDEHWLVRRSIIAALIELDCFEGEGFLFHLQSPLLSSSKLVKFGNTTYTHEKKGCQ
jgi:HEAT repeat protein